MPHSNVVQKLENAIALLFAVPFGTPGSEMSDEVAKAAIRRSEEVETFLPEFVHSYRCECSMDNILHNLTKLQLFLCMPRPRNLKVEQDTRRDLMDGLMPVLDQMPARLKLSERPRAMA